MTFYLIFFRIGDRIIGLIIIFKKVNDEVDELNLTLKATF